MFILNVWEKIAHVTKGPHYILSHSIIIYKLSMASVMDMPSPSWLLETGDTTCSKYVIYWKQLQKIQFLLAFFSCSILSLLQYLNYSCSWCRYCGIDLLHTVFYQQQDNFPVDGCWLGKLYKLFLWLNMYFQLSYLAYMILLALDLIVPTSARNFVLLGCMDLIAFWGLSIALVVQLPGFML